MCVDMVVETGPTMKFGLQTLGITDSSLGPVNAAKDDRGSASRQFEFSLWAGFKSLKRYSITLVLMSNSLSNDMDAYDSVKEPHMWGRVKRCRLGSAVWLIRDTTA